MTPEIKVYDERMLKTIEVVKANFACRPGRPGQRRRAGPASTVEYYGTPTPLNQVAAICLP